MTGGWSDQEQRIRRLSFAVNDAAQRTRKLKDGIGSLQQQVLAVAGRKTTQMCAVTIEGQVLASVALCFGYVPGATVEVWYPDNTGTLVGSTTADSIGLFEINGQIPAGGTAGTIYFSKSPMWAAGDDAIALTCGTVSQDGTIGRATGYRHTGICADPISESLDLDDSVYGVTPLTWAGSGNWTGSFTGGGIQIDYTAFLDDSACSSEPNIITGVIKTFPGGIVVGSVSSATASSLDCGDFEYITTGTGTLAYYPAGVTFTLRNP